MAFFTHEAEHYVWALLEGFGARGGNNKGFALTEDVLVPAMLACFSVSQVYIAWTLARQLRMSGKPFSRSLGQNVPALVNIALSIGYVVCACLAITNLCLKLEFVAAVQKTIAWNREFGDNTLPLPERCLEGNVYYWDETCWNETSRSLRGLTASMDKVIAGIFQAMVILAQGLLIYRYRLFLSSPWSWVTISASLLLLLSIGVFIMVLVPSSNMVVSIMRMYMSVYAPLLVSLVVSPALITRLWHELREQGKLRGEGGQLMYGRVVRILFESAIPALALGMFHPILTFGIGLGSPCYNVLWISLTVLAPQIIALRPLQAKESLLEQAAAPSRDSVSSA